MLLKWLLIILIILLFLFILIILTKITIYLNYHHLKDDDHLKIELRAWFGLIRYKKTIPLIKIDEDSPSIVVKGKDEESDNTSKITSKDIVTNLKRYREILEHVFQLNTIIRRFLKKVSVKRFEWYSVIGVGDAAITGTITGALWAVKGSIVGLFSHYFRIREMPKLMVYPNFQQVITQTELSCMFEFRIGYAMLAGIKLVKFWKGGRPRLMQNTIVSNEKLKSL